MHYNIPIGQKSHDHLDKFIKGHQQSSISLLIRITEKKSEVERAQLKTVNVVCDKSIASISLQEQKLNTFPLKFGVRQVVSSLLLFNTLLEVSARTIAQDKETGLGIGMREVR